MANKNSSNFDLDLTLGGYKVVPSAAQATQNFQEVDNYISGSIFNASASTSVTNTTTETTLIPAGLGGLVLPANFLQLGKSIEVLMYGTIATTSTPTLRIKLKLGSVVVADTTTTTLSTITGTAMWKYEGVIDCRTVGASGTVFAQGLFEYFSNASNEIGVSAPTTTAVTIDTTATQTVGVTAQWGTASASNVLTCTNAKIKVSM